MAPLAVISLPKSLERIDFGLQHNAADNSTHRSFFMRSLPVRLNESPQQSQMPLGRIADRAVLSHVESRLIYFTVSSSGCMVPATCWHTVPFALNTFSMTASKVWCLPSLLSSYDTCIVPCS